jgi:hypothetical protein
VPEQVNRHILQFIEQQVLPAAAAASAPAPQPAVPQPAAAK